MLGFDLLSTGTLLIMAASSQDLCPMPKPTAINIRPAAKQIRYDTGQSLAEIQKYQIDTINPHSFNGMSYTQGFMNGVITMEPRIKIGSLTYPRHGYSCLWYDTIEVNIEIDPEIVVAQEVYADRCARHAVIEHEMKHVKVDRKIVNKYAKIMGQRLYKELKERGFNTGLIKTEHAEAITQRMQDTVKQILQHEYQKMELERREMQQAIDNREEYERVSAQCPDFQKRNHMNR